MKIEILDRIEATHEQMGPDAPHEVKTADGKVLAPFGKHGPAGRFKIVTRRYAFTKGQVIDAPEDFAKQIIAGGHAKQA